MIPHIDRTSTLKYRNWRSIYDGFYSISRLRNLVEKLRFTRQDDYADLWMGLKDTFSLFEEEDKAKLLGITPPGGDLFQAFALGEG